MVVRTAVSFKSGRGRLARIHSTDSLNSLLHPQPEILMTIDNTTFAAASQCQCTDCPGASCRCGCQHAQSAPPAAADIDAGRLVQLRTAQVQPLRGIGQIGQHVQLGQRLRRGGQRRESCQQALEQLLVKCLFARQRAILGR